MGTGWNVKIKKVQIWKDLQLNNVSFPIFSRLQWLCLGNFCSLLSLPQLVSEMKLLLGFGSHMAWERSASDGRQQQVRQTSHYAPHSLQRSGFGPGPLLSETLIRLSISSMFPQAAAAGVHQSHPAKTPPSCLASESSSSYAVLFFPLINGIRRNFDQYHRTQWLVVKPQLIPQICQTVSRLLVRTWFRFLLKITGCGPVERNIFCHSRGIKEVLYIYIIYT